MGLALPMRSTSLLEIPPLISWPRRHGKDSLLSLSCSAAIKKERRVIGFGGPHSLLESRFLLTWATEALPCCEGLVQADQ